MLDRCVYFDHLSGQSAEHLSEYARSLAGDAMQALNRRALELQQADVENPEATARINFGLYFYRAEEKPTGKQSQ